MKPNRILVLMVLAAAMVTFNMAQAAEHPRKTEHPTKSEHPANSAAATDGTDLVSVARSVSNLQTLVTAMEASGLVAELQGEGPFTIFAPTDEAFAQLPAGTMQDLLKPANKAMLAGLLANHVVPGKIMSTDIRTMKAATVSGHDLKITLKGDSVFVDNAKIIGADIVAGNGVIHRIDQVIMATAAPKQPASAKPKDHPAH